MPRRSVRSVTLSGGNAGKVEIRMEVLYPARQSEQTEHQIQRGSPARAVDDLEACGHFLPRGGTDGGRTFETERGLEHQSQQLRHRQQSEQTAEQLVDGKLRGNRAEGGEDDREHQHAPGRRELEQPEVSRGPVEIERAAFHGVMSRPISCLWGRLPSLPRSVRRVGSLFPCPRPNEGLVLHKDLCVSVWNLSGHSTATCGLVGTAHPAKLFDPDEVVSTNGRGRLGSLPHGGGITPYTGTGICERTSSITCPLLRLPYLALLVSTVRWARTGTASRWTSSGMT